MGRNKKYEGNLVARSMALPEGLVEYIKDITNEQKISFNEYVVMAITCADKELLLQTTNKINELNDILNNTIKSNQELSNKLNGVKRLKMDLFERIEPDENISKYVKSEKERILKFKENGMNTNAIVDLVYMDLEKYVITKGLFIKKSNMTKLLIKQEILRIND